MRNVIPLGNSCCPCFNIYWYYYHWIVWLSTISIYNKNQKTCLGTVDRHLVWEIFLKAHHAFRRILEKSYSLFKFSNACQTHWVEGSHLRTTWLKTRKLQHRIFKGPLIMKHITLISSLINFDIGLGHYNI